MEKLERKRSRMVHVLWRAAEVKKKKWGGRSCCGWSALLPRAMEMSMATVNTKDQRMLRVGYNTWGHVGVREPCYHHTMLIWVVFTATQSHGNIRAQTVTKDHIALLQLGSMLIYIVHVTAKGHWIICVLKSKSHAELSLSSADPGKVGSCSRRVGPDDPSTGRAGTGELILIAWMQES